MDLKMTQIQVVVLVMPTLYQVKRDFRGGMDSKNDPITSLYGDT